LLCELEVEPHPATTAAVNTAAPTTMSTEIRLRNPRCMSFSLLSTLAVEEHAQKSLMHSTIAEVPAEVVAASA